jgi:hypothetical protein
MRRPCLFLAALSWLAFGLVPTASAADPWTTTTHIHVSDDAPIARSAAAATARSAAAATASAPSSDRDRDRDRDDDRDKDRDRDDDRRANGESPNYMLQPGQVRWHPGPRVEYRIVDAPFKRAEHAVEQSERTLDQFITTRTFRHNDKAGKGDKVDQVNPCTGQPSTIRWAPIDGPGKIVALTTICRNLANREIGGFEMVFDSTDGWSIGPDRNPRTYDVENVATHEWGHVAGLDHVAGPRDQCLTMYVATSPEEIEQRTLGWGDKRGLDALYHTRDTSPGPGCGR